MHLSEWFIIFDQLRISEKNIYTSCLSFGSSTALNPPAHIHPYELVDVPCLIL